MSDFNTLSIVLGWMYVIIWALSLYPQIWTMIELKSAEGCKFDYIFVNLSGYIFLSAYSTAGYLNPSLDVGVVDIEDLVYAYHGAVIVLFINCLMIYYPRGQNKLNKVSIIAITCMWIITISYYLMTETLNLFEAPFGLNAWKLMGYNKILISLTKYTPQILWNYQRKSTLGWNIYGNLMDLFGGILSSTQSIIEHFDQGEIFNWVKLLLGVISMIYNIIMIFQHYVLYNPKKQSLLQVQSDNTYQGYDDKI